jgi:nucleotide-binding universal stress UspA family protein
VRAAGERYRTPRALAAASRRQRAAVGVRRAFWQSIENAMGEAASERRAPFAGWRAILVPVRGGADAFTRLELALQLASGTGAQVTALYVVDERLLGDPDAGLVRDTLDNQLRQEGEQILAEMVQLAEASSAELATRLERGPVVETILKVAAEIAADAIVVGAHRQTWLGRLLGGSLAESLLRAASCAVLAVPPPSGR